MINVNLLLTFHIQNVNFGSGRTMRSRTSASRANRFSRVGSLRSCASVKSADTQYSARWSLQEQVFSSGFTNIAFHKVSKKKIITWGTGRSTGVVCKEK